MCSRRSQRSLVAVGPRSSSRCAECARVGSSAGEPDPEAIDVDTHQRVVHCQIRSQHYHNVAALLSLHGRVLTLLDTICPFTLQGLLRFAEAIKQMRAMVKECVQFAKSVNTAAETLREVKACLEGGGDPRMQLDVISRQHNESLLLNFAESVDGGIMIADETARDDWCGLLCWDSCGKARRFVRASRYSEMLQNAEQEMNNLERKINTRLLVELHGGVRSVLVQIDSLLVGSSTTCVCLGLPVGLPALLGREEETQKLLEMLASPGTIASPTGIAGAGKS